MSTGTAQRSDRTISAAELAELCYEAVDSNFVGDLDKGDAINAVDFMLDRVIVALGRDPRIPKLSRSEFELLLADTRNECEHELIEMIDGKVDLRRTIKAIVGELIEHTIITGEIEEARQS